MARISDTATMVTMYESDRTPTMRNTAAVSRSTVLADRERAGSSAILNNVFSAATI
jgi:hypothetical protein